MGSCLFHSHSSNHDEHDEHDAQAADEAGDPDSVKTALTETPCEDPDRETDQSGLQALHSALQDALSKRGIGIALPPSGSEVSRPFPSLHEILHHPPSSHRSTSAQAPNLGVSFEAMDSDGDMAKTKQGQYIVGGRMTRK